MYSCEVAAIVLGTCIGCYCTSVCMQSCCRMSPMRRRRILPALDTHLLPPRIELISQYKVVLVANPNNRIDIGVLDSTPNDVKRKILLTNL